MRILFISGLQIFPPESGGQLRSANLIKALNRLGHEVDIYSYTGRRKDYLSLKKSSSTPITKSIEEFTNRSFLWGILQHLFYKLDLPPLWLYFSSQFHYPKKLKEMEKKADLVIADFPFLSPLKKRTHRPFMINTHNAEFELWKKNKFLSRYVKKIEHDSFKKADKVFFCHINDMEKFNLENKTFKEKSLIIPNGIEVNAYLPQREVRTKIRAELGITDVETVFLFSGSQYAPNIEAFTFLREWSQQNKKALRDLKATILIAGSVYPKLIDEPHFKSVGIVKEILPYFWASDFGLNPIRSGSGTNLKMMEYIASQLPILSTKFGTRGLELIDQYSYLTINEENFGDTLSTAISLSYEKRKQITEYAFKQNAHLLDMSHSLKELSWSK